MQNGRINLLSIVPYSFSQVFNLLSISEKSSKIKFLKKFKKILFKFLCKKWGREALGTPQGDPPCHHTTWWCGEGQATSWHGVGPPWPSTYLSTSHFTLSPEKSPLHYSNPCSCSRFLISLLSPSLLLRFGAFVLWYVTPSIIQVEFCLVEYFLSILAL
jgi:hypothetical protein